MHRRNGTHHVYHGIFFLFFFYNTLEPTKNIEYPTLTSVVLALTVKSFPRDKANLKAQAKYATFKGVCQIPNMTFEIKLGKEEKKN